jgi:hypothetical protein
VRLRIALSLLILAGAPVFSADSLELAVQSYLGNTLVCHNPTSGVVCRLWLNADGRYFVFFNRGALEGPATLQGPFQIEMREGRYTVRSDSIVPQLCLWPAAPRIKLDVEAEREIFSAAECYALPQLTVGQTVPGRDAAGRVVQFWLLAGR